MPSISEALQTALAHHQAGRLQLAEAIYRRILAAEPQNANVLHLLGVVAQQAGRHETAIELIERAIVIEPANAAYHNSLGAAYVASGQFHEAVACCRRALQLNPTYAEAHINLGNARKYQGRLEEAATCYERALQLKPNAPQAHYNLGNVHFDHRRLDEAAAAYSRALLLRPEFAEAHNNLGTVRREQGLVDDAIACYQRALRLRPDYAAAHYNLGLAFKDRGQLSLAAASYQRALQTKPDYAEAHYNLGIVARERGELDRAVARFGMALRLKPDFPAALGALANGLAHLCQWDELMPISQRLIEAVDADAGSRSASFVSPLTMLSLPVATTASQQMRCARQWASGQLRAPAEPASRIARRSSSRRSKIVVGYLSSNFHAHAIAYLTAELFEKHDRDRFHVMGYSYGPDDGSEMRGRLVKAFDRFVDLQDAPFTDAAQRIADDEVDILVDLNGYTKHARTQILALRPAPIQVNYLGYPGTMGASFIDYILVDEFVVPADQQPFFTEKLVHLPGCYQVNDSRREIAVKTPSRAECGLPPAGFVFCGFNNSHKMTPEMFDLWMSLLKSVEASVLWLLERNRFAPINLRREAEARGVAGERLVFAPRMPLAEHLARQRLSDLFLDTFPYNAHTTASDALWAGCPVLTMAGETFASRVAGSLLRVVGLPELITSSFDEYLELALALAKDAERLAGLRARLKANLSRSPLFDAARFARNVEQAYSTMAAIRASGEPPRAFAV
ncbi:MAG TPA: tetratricopeptide repeat protein [Planctomycetaceae bacterium]|nr:tetratricopeptide repeat protein [Planctomycetaceae bacterium]